jgi:hypothetical protein
MESIPKSKTKEHRMKLFKAFVCCAIVAAPMVAVAQAPNNPCSALHWSEKFLEMYPRAALACQDVVVRDGVKYAKFEGNVLKVEKNAVEVEVHNVAKTAVGSALWHTTPDQPMNIGGKEAMAKDLKKGDLLTFYVAEGTYTMAPQPGAKPVVTKVK